MTDPQQLAERVQRETPTETWSDHSEVMVALATIEARDKEVREIIQSEYSRFQADEHYTGGMALEAIFQRLVHQPTNDKAQP